MLGASPAAASGSADLAAYRAADRRLAASLGRRRPPAVFMGDSITQYWELSRSFPGRGFVDRGIAGQTSVQILGRFDQDVVSLRPRVVVLLAGTNDLRLDVPAATTEADIARMAALARTHRIGVVLATLPPVSGFPAGWLPGGREGPGDTRAALARRVAALNAWIVSFAGAHHLAVARYHAVLAGPDRGWGGGLTRDGVHPSAAGYARMAPVAARALDAVLAGTAG